MSERDEAYGLAHRVLSRQSADPDDDLAMLARTLLRLREAVFQHHGQKADDRCIEDDDRLYAAAGLPPCDRRVGDKAAMLKNCERFIERRCEGGGWPTYAELEARLQVAESQNRSSFLAGATAYAAAFGHSGLFSENETLRKLRDEWKPFVPDVGHQPVTCKVCHAALYHEAANVGYCTDHEPK